MHISKVGETEQRLLAPKNDYWRIYALHQKVDEIDPLGSISSMFYAQLLGQ